jgi:hypothetical protein
MLDEVTTNLLLKWGPLALAPKLTNHPLGFNGNPQCEPLVGRKRMAAAMSVQTGSGLFPMKRLATVNPSGIDRGLVPVETHGQDSTDRGTLLFDVMKRGDARGLWPEWPECARHKKRDVTSRLLGRVEAHLLFETVKHSIGPSSVLIRLETSVLSSFYLVIHLDADGESLGSRRPLGRKSGGEHIVH